MNCIHCQISIILRTNKKFCSKICRDKHHHKLEKERIDADVNRQEIKKYRSRCSYRRKNGIDLQAPIMYKKGEGHICKSGYKVIKKKDHPNSQKSGAIFEHVFIMSEHLGRPLFKEETVHHKNGIRNDNRIENLELWNNKHGKGQRVEDKIQWCKEFLDKYGYDVINK